MKRKPKLTKKERKALNPGPRPAPAGGGHHHEHIHCIACGKHLDAEDFDPPATATMITCDHGSNFPSCVTCMSRSLEMVKEHDRSGKPVASTAAWH